jgi:hypothetical protein
MKNGVWEIVPRPEGKSVVTSKWVYKIKHTVNDSIDKYKARFVARGFSQQEGEDYDETFAPVARYTSISCSIHGLKFTSDGCKDHFSQWSN